MKKTRAATTAKTATEGTATEGTATFKLSGSVEDGTFVMSMVQIPDQPPVEPPTEPPVEPPTEPEPPNPPQPSDPSQWSPPRYLRTDTNPEPIPATPRPAYLTPIVDPTFQTKITRITGDPGTAIRNISGGKWGDVVRHHYNCDQAWNADESMIYLDTNKGAGATPGNLFLHGETYEPLFGPKNKPSSADIRWTASDPSLMHFAHKSILGVWNPKSGEQEVIKDFGSAYSELTFGPWKGSFSTDDDTVVLTGKRGGRDVAFAYKVSTDTKSPDVYADMVTSSQSMSSCRISPNGTSMVWDFSPDTCIVTDLNGRITHALATNSISHFDVITDTSPDEVVVGRVNSSSIGQGKSGIVSKYRLRDGRRTGLATGGWCSHTSTRAVRAHRWAVADAQPQGGSYPPYDGELIMCALTGSAVYRLGHTQSPRTVDYDAQVQASHAPHPGRVIFGSAWRATGSAPRPVGCYVVDFRT